MRDKLTNTILHSFSMLGLKEGWDGKDANIITTDNFHKAMIFIHLLASHVENLIPPNINPGRNNSIDFSFTNTTTGHRLLVNIKNPKATCFGYDGTDENGDVIKSSDVVMQDIIEWCIKFMTNTN